MNPYTLSVLAKINVKERLAEAEASRLLFHAKRAQRREAPVAPETPVVSSAPVCSTG
jgi:hypothetical protein